MTNLQQQLKTAFPHYHFEFDFPLADKTYFKVGGPAEVYLELDDKKDIIEFVGFCRKNELRLTLFGGGSNVIVADEGIEGVVLHLKNDWFEIIDEQGTTRKTVRVGAGLKTAALVRKTVEAGLGGLEYFMGVPGSVGGAVYNNAHYLEDLISEHISRIEIIDERGVARWLTNEEAEFSYDSSRFQKTKDVILQVEFVLESRNKEESQALVRKATIYRAKTQPLALPSSGCIFQNVPNTPELKKQFPQFADKNFVPGGFLIDQAGLKGTKIGGIEVSEKHAAFFVNNGQGTAKEIKELIEKVKREIKEKFGVTLQEEVFWLR